MSTTTSAEPRERNMSTAVIGERAVGRNTSSVAAGPDGLVMRKRFEGGRGDAERRYRNSLAWDDLQRQRGLAISPAVVGRDDEHRTLTFAYVADARSLQEILDDGSDGGVPTELLVTCGRLLAQVHSMETPGVDLVRRWGESASAPEPVQVVDGPLAKFSYLTPEQFASASGGELECWRLFHHDEQLQQALATWLTIGAADPARVPLHGDLRPDQFLISPDGVFVVDWEEFTRGPATRDLAGIAGALVYDALVRTFAGDLGGLSTTAEVHHALLTRGRTLLEATRPRVASFLAAYEAAAPAPADRTRLAADVGWYVIERVVARSMLSQRLGASDRAIAGIGRQALIDPRSLAGLLGGEDAR
jgi:hypothetical protein